MAMTMHAHISPGQLDNVMPQLKHTSRTLSAASCMITPHIFAQHSLPVISTRRHQTAIVPSHHGVRVHPASHREQLTSCSSPRQRVSPIFDDITLII